MTLIHTGPTRRRLLQAAAASGLGLIAAPALPRYAGAQSWRAGDPFSLGVASGAPRRDGFVLWTRLAPEPLHGGGMPRAPVAVEWQVATDDRMRNLVRRGRCLPLPERPTIAMLSPGATFRITPLKAAPLPLS